MRKNSIHPAGFFLLRMPLLPFRALADAPPDPWPRLREALQHDAVIREALFLASPALFAAAAGRDEPPRRVQASLLRYLSRMSTRPTPFGLLAGVTMGAIGTTTGLEAGSRDAWRRHTRIDNRLLFALTEQIASEPGVRRRLLCRPNETIHEAAGQLRYIEYEVRDLARHYRIAALEPDEALLQTLARARDGATVEQLARGLTADDQSISPEDALDYVSALVDAQILLHDLRPPVTGHDPLTFVAAAAQRTGSAAADMLETVRGRLASLDAKPLGVPDTDYRELAALIPGGDAALDAGALLQTDLSIDAPVTLAKRTAEAMLHAAGALHRLFGRSRSEELTTFREAFRERFVRREVPLMLALDADLGVAFGEREGSAESPLIADLRLPPRPAPPAPFPPGTHALLLRLIHDAVAARAIEVELRPADLEALTDPEPLPLPATFAIYGALASTDAGAPIRVDAITGAPGARVLARFCHPLPALESALREYVAADRYGDALMAEVVHIPEGRLGNIVVRPRFHEHELPLLGRSGAPDEQQLALDDLTVSVIGDEVVLRSRRLGKRVIPRITNAHNYAAFQNVPLYRFFGLLQTQGEAARIRWSWGTLGDAPFLPRVRYGRGVLTVARWNVPAAELHDPSAVAETRVRRALPRFVEHEGLVVDLDNAIAVEDLCREARQRRVVSLSELFPGETQLAASSDSGGHVHELVVPFINEQPRTIARPRVPSGGAVVRTLPPGSEWTFAKVYSGTAFANEILLETLVPAVHALLGSGAADRWFFARYADPRPHLRLRVHGSAAAIVENVSAAVRPLLEQGIVARLQFDTYEREVERYGGAGAIDLAEEIFGRDSESVVRLLSLRPPAEQLWRVALEGVHLLLSELLEREDDRIAAVREVRQAFAGEMRAGANERVEIGRRFRALQPALRNGDERFSAILRERSRAIASPAAALRALEREGRLTVPLQNVAISAMHMFVNRLLHSDARVHELVLYDFLERLYLAERARRAPAPES